MSDYTKELWEAARHGDGSDSGPDASTIWPQGAVVELSPADADRAVACVNALAGGLNPAGIGMAVATLRTLAHASDLPPHQRALAAAALEALQPSWGSVGDGEAAG